MLTIAQVLTAEEADAMAALVRSSESAFADGRKTAGWHAQEVKSNEQLDPQTAAVIVEKVSTALRANAVFMAAARPREFPRIVVSRYREGMEYGLHVDDALMNNRRTDLSFTLFVSDPATYEGGDLVIDTPGGEVSVKENAGDLFLYPATALHRVSPVLEGERLAVVGWVRSFVRGAEQRDILFELDNAIASGRQEGMSRDTLGRLLKVKNNLIRLWAED